MGDPARRRDRSSCRLDPRERDRRARDRGPPAHARAARRACSSGWSTPANPDGVRHGTRQNAPRRRPQPQLPAALVRRRQPVGHVLPGRRGRVRARDARAARARDGRAARPDAQLPPAHAARRPAARRRSGPVRDYARRVGLPARCCRPTAGPPSSWQNQLVPAGRHGVRRRAAGRSAAGPRDPAPRAGRARRRGARPRRRRRGGRAEAADRVGPDPVRPRPAAPDAALLAPPLRRREGEARAPRR